MAEESRLLSRVATRLWETVDGWTTDILNADKAEMVRKKYGTKMHRTRLFSPEEEVKQLITSAETLEDIWDFFYKRLRNGSEVEFLCLSVLDESGDFIRVQFLHPLADPHRFHPPLVSMSDRNNHLIHAFNRKDTTFTGNIAELGQDVLGALGIGANDTEAERPAPAHLAHLNLFSVPLIAGNRTIALVTLGCSEIDTFSQAKLSYVYTIRDQIAQLVWNLILRERMKSQVQMDGLTGLLSHGYFQRALEEELIKAEQADTPLTIMLLDINNIQEINDKLGHQQGDVAICHLASTVRRLIRGIDIVARYGGDEVAIILPETDPDTADEIAQRFMTGLRERTPAGLKNLSVSIGYATFLSDTRKRENALKLAEQALHLATFKGSKTGASISIAYREVDQVNDKTVLEVFASRVAKKYATQGSSVFEELVKRVERREEVEPASPDDLMVETIGSLAGALDAKDKYTRGHSQAVSNYAVALAHALQMGPEEVENVRLAAFLHDIGKIGIPESILCKPGPLNEKEWDIMKQHPVIGARQILAPVTALKDVIPMVEFHHENWDGTGHPMGLKGEEIPLGARIVSIVDAFHALTSDRAYRKALPISEAKKIIEAGSGTKWDPNLVRIFLNILEIASPRAAQEPQEIAVAEPVTQTEN